MSARLRRAGLALLVAAVPVAAAGGYAVAADQAQPQREDLAASKDPVGAKGRTLGLTRVVVPAGARLAAHTHPGTQISRIDEGTLTYTVQRGSVRVMRGDATAPRLVRRVRSGQTVRLRAGQWIVEAPGMVHRAANRTTKRVVISLASLFPNGAPPSSPAR